MMSLRKEELVLAACLLETTDASLSAEDAMADVKQIMMNLHESLDPAYRGLLAKAACILLSSNRFSPKMLGNIKIPPIRKPQDYTGMIVPNWGTNGV